MSDKDDRIKAKYQRALDAATEEFIRDMAEYHHWAILPMDLQPLFRHLASLVSRAKEYIEVDK